RGFVYALVRAWTCVVQRDLQIETVIGDIYAGRPVVYTDLLAYDEVAHHSGTERHDTLRVLRRMDRQLARVEAAAKDAPRPYAFVVLSDHGQTQGPPFRQRWGQSLEELVRQATDVTTVEGPGRGEESWGYLAGSLTEAAGGSGWTAKGLRRITRSRTTEDVVQLGPAASLSAMRVCTTSIPGRSRVSTHCDPSGSTPRPTLNGPTASSTWPTSWSTALTIPTPTRSSPSRRWWARTGAWEDRSPFLSCSCPAGGRLRIRLWWERKPCTSGCAAGSPSSARPSIASNPSSTDRPPPLL